MRDPWNDSELAARFRRLAATSLPRAPLYAAMSLVIADHRGLASMLSHAPPTQQQPVLMLAAIHHLVLDEPDKGLAAWYRNLSDDPRDPNDPELAPTVHDFVMDRAPSMYDLLATRRAQTNEVGRCGLFLPLMTATSDETGEPLVHVDVGTSGGLNLLLPRFAYRYDGGSPIGSSPVTIDVDTRGVGPTPDTIPLVAASVGIDTHPIDVGDPTETRWLEACCWPDQADRFHRLRAAITLAAHDSLDIVTGDAVDSIGQVVDDRAHLGHPVVTTSWVLNYLSPARRVDFVDALDAIGDRRDLSWIVAESPSQTPEIPHSSERVSDRLELTELSLVTWRGGKRTDRHLGTCHPHGYWIHWD